MADTPESIQVHAGRETYELPFELVEEMAMSHLPDIIVAPFDTLSPAEQTMRLGLKPVVRFILGMMTWVCNEYDKEGKYPRPLTPEQLVKHNVDILLYVVRYVTRVALIAAGGEVTLEFTTRPPAGPGGTAIREITGLHPTTSPVVESQELGEGRGGSGQSSPGQPQLPAESEPGGRHPGDVERPLGDSGSNGHREDDLQQAADVGISAPLQPQAGDIHS